MKKAILTLEENKTWIKYFEYYLNLGYSDKKADFKAWIDLQKEFPRLQEFNGIKN